jgi:hypothetical protein
MSAVHAVHEAVLAQSAPLATIIDKKRKTGFGYRLSLRLQTLDPKVFRRILQYLYSQKLPIATADKNERPKQQCEEYIMACQLELDVMQSLILQSLDDKEDGISSETFLDAANLVYKADEARVTFREMFKRRLQACIEEEGLDTDNYVTRFVRKTLTSGGRNALDTGDILMTLAEERKLACSNEVNGEQLQEFINKFTELQTVSNEWKSKATSAGVRVEELKMISDGWMSEAERTKARIAKLQLENKGFRSKAERTKAHITELQTENKELHSKAESTEARLTEMKKALAPEQLEAGFKAFLAMADSTQDQLKTAVGWENEKHRTTMYGISLDDLVEAFDDKADIPNSKNRTNNPAL